VDRLKTKAVVIDANVIISAFAFGGKPAAVVELALCREFLSATGENILAEVRKNLLGKLEFLPKQVNRFLSEFSDVSSVYVPSGKVKLIQHPADSLVLEVALDAGANIIVTGDKKHLLPLGSFQGITIEPPSRFLARFA
jgi:putative PIN family toxin of toxin-antitoxin system